MDGNEQYIGLISGDLIASASGLSVVQINTTNGILVSVHSTSDIILHSDTKLQYYEDTIMFTATNPVNRSAL